MTPGRVLICGSGGREHALAWRLCSEPGVERVFVAPGNAGMAAIADVRPEADPGDQAAVTALARETAAELVVVGPERPLAEGLADALAVAGIPVFGPLARAARLEASKAFCRDVAEGAGVPMAEGAAFDDPRAASAFARRLGTPIVIKADGLAAGKGVTVCQTLEEADEAIRDAMLTLRFGRAGERVVVERALAGREASVVCITDGEATLALPAARDHKRARDRDTGPNTGGMGAYSPLDDLDDGEAAALVERIHVPLLRELGRRGIRFRGALYAGLMLTIDGPYLLECNVRLGDPETQVVLPRLESALAPLMLAAATGRLDVMARRMGLSRAVLTDTDATVGVVLAAAGYPGTPRSGDPIGGGDEAERDALVFWSGVSQQPDGTLVTDGGRVATVVGRGATMSEAADAAYLAASRITFAGGHFRRDIGRAAASSALASVSR